MDISSYRSVIPKMQHLVNLCREVGIPIFYTEATREPSGIDLLTRVHRILPKSREERIKKTPICVRGTWDAQTIDELKPTDSDSYWCYNDNRPRNRIILHFLNSLKFSKKRRTTTTQVRFFTELISKK
jgi:nicotinamidase-related amidase